IRYGLHVGGNILKIRQVGLADKDALELRTNTGIGLLDFHGPWKGRSVIDRRVAVRSEEHTSELQSRGQLVCRLLLEKKKRHHRRKLAGRTRGAAGDAAQVHRRRHRIAGRRELVVRPEGAFAASGMRLRGHWRTNLTR